GGRRPGPVPAVFVRQRLAARDRPGRAGSGRAARVRGTAPDAELAGTGRLARRYSVISSTASPGARWSRDHLVDPLRRPAAGCRGVVDGDRGAGYRGRVLRG